MPKNNSPERCDQRHRDAKARDKVSTHGKVGRRLREGEAGPNYKLTSAGPLRNLFEYTTPGNLERM